MVAEFTEFKKIPRLNRDVVITEKIDGTNAAVLIQALPTTPEGAEPAVYPEMLGCFSAPDATVYGVWAQSRSRFATPEKDNYGFAAWVKQNFVAIAKVFEPYGPGLFFGEWWGGGVQRKYGLTAKRFSLFNVSRFGAGDEVRDPRCLKGFHRTEEDPIGTPIVEHAYHKGQKMCACRPAQSALRAEVGGVLIGPVPVLYRGSWFIGPHWAPTVALDLLRREGSQAAPGFDKPEGIVVFHEASGQLFKATLENDEKPKGQP